MNGILNNAVREVNVTFDSKSNLDVQENRNYSVVLKHTSKNRDSNLVKLQTNSQTMTVIIVDDDFCTFTIYLL